MIFLIIVAVVIGIIAYNIIERKSNKIRMTFSLARPSIDWENRQREERIESKKAGIQSIKTNFKKPETLGLALLGIEDAVKRFISNHGFNFIDIRTYYNNLIVPDGLKNKELFIRKELEAEYRQRVIDEHKLKSIYLAYQHLKLLLDNPQNSWSDFKGLHCLQTNLKAEEYFDGLAGILFYVKDLFSDNPAIKGIDTQLEKLFALWATREKASKIYKENMKLLTKEINVSNKHFILVSIIDYLSRRYKYNPSFRGELVDRCLEDIAIYEKFLMAFESFRFEKFNKDGDYIKLKYTFEDIKKLPDYNPPRLNSFDVLYEIYEKEKNVEGIKWLEDIGTYIKY